MPEELTRERSVKVVDLRQLRDESQGALSAHTGRHPGVISQLLASLAGRFYMNDEYKFVRECVERGERVLLLAFCVSNRHRSVAFAICLGAAFWPMPVMVIHIWIPTWTATGRQCAVEADATSAARGFAASATALRNRVISHLSPAALGPLQAQQVRQRSMPPDLAAHAFPRSSAPGPAAPIYHRLRAASVSGAAAGDAPRRPAEPPSNPRATRSAPQSLTTAAIALADVTLDDQAQGVECWKMRAIRAEAQTDMYKDELRMVRAEADALRERAAAAERELIIRCEDESDRCFPSDLQTTIILLSNKIRLMLRDTGKATVDRDGWYGPVGAEATVATFFFTTSAGGVDPVRATHFASNGIDPWTIAARLFFSTSRDTSRCSTRMWRCNRSRPGRQRMIVRINSSSSRDPFRARVRSWLLTRPIVGETLDLLPLDLVEAMAEARAASAVPVRTAAR